MLKRFWSLFVLLGLLVSCSDDNDAPTPVPEPAEDGITVLTYLIANNNLNDYLVENICIMYDGLAAMAEPATMLIYWDGETSIGENNAKHLILKYQTDGKGNINGVQALDASSSWSEVLAEAIILKEYKDQVSTDKEVMATVLQDMVEFSPTEKLGLVIGAHGSAWLNRIETGARALGYDGSYSNSINLPDMVEALESVDKVFEFILFDACYMATAEVAYEFRKVAKYQISSVMEVAVYGFPYDYFMSHLYGGTVEGYQKVCQSFIDFYQQRYENKERVWGTVALIDSKEVDNLTEAIHQEIVSHKDALADYDASHLQEYGRSPAPYLVYDLEHWVKDLNGGEVPEAFKAQLDKSVLYKGCLEKAGRPNYNVDASNYCGVGIYIPIDVRPNSNTYFKTLDWFTASGWNEVDFSWNF